LFQKGKIKHLGDQQRARRQGPIKEKLGGCRKKKGSGDCGPSTQTQGGGGKKKGSNVGKRMLDSPDEQQVSRRRVSIKTEEEKEKKSITKSAPGWNGTNPRGGQNTTKTILKKGNRKMSFGILMVRTPFIRLIKKKTPTGEGLRKIRSREGPSFAKYKAHRRIHWKSHLGSGGDREGRIAF